MFSGVTFIVKVIHLNTMLYLLFYNLIFVFYYLFCHTYIFLFFPLIIDIIQFSIIIIFREHAVIKAGSNHSQPSSSTVSLHGTSKTLTWLETKAKTIYLIRYCQLTYYQHQQITDRPGSKQSKNNLLITSKEVVTWFETNQKLFT